MSRNVLIVEDDPVNRYVLERTVRAAGFEPLAATSAEDALALLTNDLLDPPCAVILDGRLPRMSGGEFLQKLRAEERLARLPVIVVSGAPEQLGKARQLATAVFRKPVDPLTLTAALKTHLPPVAAD